MKKFILILLLVTAAKILIKAETYTPQTGDIIFHSSCSSQSTAIKIGTMSIYSHCGLIIVKEGQVYVLEAENGVELTPFDVFVKRGTLGGHYRIMRLKTPQEISINISTGGKYDKAFRFNNDKYYCSELVWEVYKQNDIILANPKQLKDYHFLYLPMLQKHIKQRGFNLNQEVIAPSDLVKSPKLKTVYSGR